MALKKRKVELFKLQFSAIDDQGNELTFQDFILNHLDNHEFNDGWKNVYFKVLKQDSNFLIVGIETTKMYGIPPKNDIKTHVPSPLDLTPEEGIGYSNVFLYDKKFKVLYYEFNQNGLWVTTFNGHIQSLQNTESCPYEIKSSVTHIMRKEAYQRLINYGRYLQVELQIANPDGLTITERTKNDSILNVIKTNQGMNAETLNYVFKVDSRYTDNTLHIPTIRRQINQIWKLISNDKNGHVTKYKVTGFHGDGNGSINRKDTIDLVNDKFSRTFEINEPRIKQDLQLNEKKVGIEDVYKRCLPEIKDIFRN